MDQYFTPNADTVVKNRKEGKLMQATINQLCLKELREKAYMEIARWMYGIPFNAVNAPSFAVAIETIGQNSPSLKPPSDHKVRVPLLKKKLKIY